MKRNERKKKEKKESHTHTHTKKKKKKKKKKTMKFNKLTRITTTYRVTCGWSSPNTLSRPRKYT